MKIKYYYKNKSPIYLLPSLITLSAMCCGMFAIFGAIHDKFIHSAYLIFFAMLLDSLDGRFARLTNTTSIFGAELDSLADMMNFGVAPAIIAYKWGLFSFGVIGNIVAFVYVATTALRLARFNSIQLTDKRFFLGLPSTAAAPLVIGYIAFFSVYINFFLKYISITTLNIGCLIIMLIASFSMVSNIKFYSFKAVHLKRKHTRINILFIILLLLALLIAYPIVIIFIFFLLYTIISYICTFIDYLKNIKHNHNS